MEAWKRDSGCLRFCDTSNYFFSVRETDRASASVWVAPRGNENDKAKSQRRDPRMGWHHRGCPTTTNVPGNNSQDDAERSFPGPLVRDWTRHQCMGTRKFPDDRRATRERGPAHYLGRTRCGTEGHQSGVTMEMQIHALKNRFGKRVTLAGGHAHRLDQSIHEGHQRNVALSTIGNDKVAGRRVCTVHGRCSDPIDPEFDGPHDPDTTKVAWEDEICNWATRSNGMTNSQIMKVHESSGHPGIRRTAYFARWVCPTITKADVRSAIRAYEQCQTIDPVPIHWTKGGLAVKGNWQRLGIDITH